VALEILRLAEEGALYRAPRKCSGEGLASRSSLGRGRRKESRIRRLYQPHRIYSFVKAYIPPHIIANRAIE